MTTLSAPRTTCGAPSNSTTATSGPSSPRPATTVTPTTLLLVAQDGEWTRRPVPDARTAQGFAKKAKIPVYDVNLTGYPSRMREWTARRRREERGLPRPDPTP